MKIVVIYNGERGRKVIEALKTTEHEVFTVTNEDVNDPDFVAGRLSTAFMDRFLSRPAAGSRLAAAV